MKYYLKCYYGYQNLGDELLIFGLLDYLFSHKEIFGEIEEVVIEAGDKVWLDMWLENSKDKIGQNRTKIKTEFIPRGIYSHIKNLFTYSSYQKIFGGGEVFTEQRGWRHGMYNYGIKFFWTIVCGRFFLLGGIGTPTHRWSNLFLSLVLPRAKNIIVREKTSYNVVKKYTSHVIQYHDFVEDLLVKKINISSGNSQYPYLLININSHVFNQDSIKKILLYLEKNKVGKKVFFPCDMNDDLCLYAPLKKKIPDLELYDRTKHSVEEILEFFAKSSGGIGARLHFLYILKKFGKQFEPIVYQEKILKFLEHVR